MRHKSHSTKNEKSGKSKKKGFKITIKTDAPRDPVARSLSSKSGSGHHHDKRRKNRGTAKVETKKQMKRYIVFSGHVIPVKPLITNNPRD